MTKRVNKAYLFLSCMGLSGCCSVAKEQVNVDDMDRTPPYISSENENTLTSGGDKQASLTLWIEDEKFEICLAETPAAAQLVQLLPKSFIMHDLNQQEKYYVLSQALPEEPISVGQIQAGDVMLYGRDTLVIFYKKFETFYSYTRLGKVVNPVELAKLSRKGPLAVEINN